MQQVSIDHLSCARDHALCESYDEEKQNTYGAYSWKVRY